MKFTGLGLVLMGIMIGLFAGIVFEQTRPDAGGVSAFLVVFAGWSVALGATTLAFGGRGYSRPDPVPA